MKDSKLSLIAVTLCFATGIALIEVAASLFTATGLTLDLFVRSVAIGALCGLIVDVLRFVSGQIRLKPHPTLKCKQPGKDMRRLLERSLGPAQSA